MMTSKETTLCAPVPGTTCFACCPPIRPAHYEHIQYRGIVQRILRENTADFRSGSREVIPITGFSCWALGYLDAACRTIGCLLHPARNGGEDLRYRVDYGDKCRRETCPEAMVFSALGPDEQRFWLHLAGDLDSFSYSSRKHNPVFLMMNWGKTLLASIPETERSPMRSWPDFLARYPFFSAGTSPRKYAYLVNRLVGKKGLDLLRSDAFGPSLEGLSMKILDRVRRYRTSTEAGDPVHRLDLDRDFLDFLRLSARIRRLHREDALRINDMVQEVLEDFCKTSFWLNGEGHGR